jgi:hypothetical protein
VLIRLGDRQQAFRAFTRAIEINPDDSEAISNVGTFHLAEGRIIAAKAREVVAANGLGDRIKLIAKHSTELRIGPDLSERAQVLVIEVFGTSAINELVIPTSALLHRQPTPGSIAAAERRLGEVSRLKVEVVDAAMASARKRTSPETRGPAKGLRTGAC